MLSKDKFGFLILLSERIVFVSVLAVFSAFYHSVLFCDLRFEVWRTWKTSIDGTKPLDSVVIADCIDAETKYIFVIQTWMFFVDDAEYSF